MKKLRILTVVALVCVLAVCALASCGGDDHTHTFQDATCTTPKTCSCGATEGEALGHDYEAVVTAPTCEAGGFTTYTCHCGDTYVADEVAAAGHNYEAVVTAPTCEEDGYTTYTCACGHSYVGSVVVTEGHDYEAVVTAPTCEEGGFTTYTCHCGDSYVADEVAAAGHDYEAVVTAPTCEANGFTTYTCHCDDSYVADIVPATHSYNSEGVCSACNGEILATDPIVGKPYIFGMTQGKVNNTVYYLKGGMNGYYMATTTNPAEAIFVYLEEAEGGYYMYCYVSNVKTYINMVVSGTHVNGAYEATAATVYTIDTEHNTVIAKVSGEDYWFATRNDNTYTTMGPCKVSYAGFYGEFYGAHIHSFVEDGVVAPTCEAEGYTAYVCSCGAIDKRDVVAALNHIEGEWTVQTAPTCTEAGVKVITCQREECGKVIKTEAIDATGHTYVDGKCACGVEDPNYEAHVHNYDEVVTAPTCTTAGFTTYTCACGDSYTGNETPVADHVDANLDITCDYEGCTKRILPAADSKISFFTANHMIIVSLSNSYYVEGVVTEVLDEKNGVFVIEDEEGYDLLIRLPKDSNNTSYSSWTANKVVVGDTIQLYGKPTRNTSSTYKQTAKIEGGILTVLKHEHNFSDATCTAPGECGCLAIGDPALGHIDEDGDSYCDRCPWNMNMALSNIIVRTDAEGNGVLDDAKTKWQWSDDKFTVEIAKGKSSFTLYTSAKAYMQLKKQNDFTVYNTTGAKISTITIYTTNASQLTNLKAAAADLTFTANDAEFSITIEVDSTGDFTFTNVGTSTAYISGVEIVYIPAAE